MGYITLWHNSEWSPDCITRNVLAMLGLSMHHRCSLLGLEQSILFTVRHVKGEIAIRCRFVRKIDDISISEPLHLTDSDASSHEVIPLIKRTRSILQFAARCGRSHHILSKLKGIIHLKNTDTCSSLRLHTSEILRHLG